jgi:hypothetical protein
MKLVYTEQALKSLTESLELIAPHVSIKVLETLRNNILDRADKIIGNPTAGRRE